MRTDVELQVAFEQLIEHGAYKPSEMQPELLDRLAEFDVAIAEGCAFLAPETELLNRASIRANLDESTRSWLRDIEIFPCIASTNTELCNRAKDEAIDGVVLLAETQTGGRGRRGRAWLSPFAQNIALSAGLQLDATATAIQPLSLVVGQVVLDSMRQLGAENLALKWPNDILLRGAKLGGILIELVSATRPVELVVGIGINIGAHASIQTRVENEVAELRSEIQGAIRNRLVSSILNNLHTSCREFELHGFKPFRDQWEKNDYYRGKNVRIEMPAETIEGVDIGVGEDGSLLLQTGDQVRNIVAGEVSLRSR